MTGLRGITVCVGYDDLLSITLRQNMRYLDDQVVVTHPADSRTKELAASVPNVRVFETDAFYRHGARFNKGLAIEEAFDFLGRHGWILIWDADTLFPGRMDLTNLRPDCLYSPRRKLLEDPRRYDPRMTWEQMGARTTHDVVFAGYFQLFHADCQYASTRPWYDVTFTHAGGCDGYFQTLWPEHLKIRPDFEVLHLGPRDTNWCGRVSHRLDGVAPDGLEQNSEQMRALLSYKGWGVVKVKSTFDERVDVPGYQPSGFIP